MLNYFDVIKAQSGVPVKDIWAQLWGNTMSTEYVIATYTGTLPAVLAGTKAGYLHRYKVYGNSSGGQECGERTENRIDFNRQRSDTFVLDTTKYIYGARADAPITNPSFIQKFTYNNSNFTILTSAGPGVGFLVEVKPNTTYTMVYQCDVIVPTERTSAVLNLITSESIFGTLWGVYGDDRSSTFTTNADTAYVYLVFRTIGSRATYSNIMLVEGSTAPTSYIPFGYKLPMLSGSTPVDIYIGDETLSAEEYVNSGTGKIYRMVGGVLTPVDPPVPFPQIPTTATSTTISWGGSGLAPSKVELEYEKRR